MNISELKELEFMMNKPDNYFDLDKNPVIGNGSKGPRFKDKKILDYTIVGGIDIIQDEILFNNDCTDYRTNFKKKEDTQISKKKPAIKMMTYDTSDIRNKMNPKANPNYLLLSHKELDAYYRKLQHSLDESTFNVTINLINL